MNRLLVAMSLVLLAFPVRAAGEGGMFGQGSTHFSLVGGNGYAFENNYFVIWNLLNAAACLNVVHHDGIRGEVKWDVIGKRAAGRYRNFSACAFVNQVHISDVPAILGRTLLRFWRTFRCRESTVRFPGE